MKLLGSSNTLSSNTLVKSLGLGIYFLHTEQNVLTISVH